VPKSADEPVGHVYVQTTPRPATPGRQERRRSTVPATSPNTRNIGGNLIAADGVSAIERRRRRMRARALFAGIVGALLLAVASPAAAKWTIARAHISGPGLGGDLRISGPAIEGMWHSGIDVAGALDDTRADSAVELGLAAAELGPRYPVTYRIHAGGSTAVEIVRQELYPYAKGGPVTYTPPGQRIAEDMPWGGVISAGWYQSSLEFFDYLVDQGLPETRPVIAADHESAPATAPTAATLWGLIALALAGLVALSVAAVRLRRRVVAVARAHR
jgi:hypothetical protein